MKGLLIQHIHACLQEVVSPGRSEETSDNSTHRVQAESRVGSCTDTHNVFLCLFVCGDHYAFVVQNAINLQSNGKRAPSAPRRIIVAAINNDRIARFQVSCKHPQLVAGELFEPSSQGQIPWIVSGAIVSIHHITRPPSRLRVVESLHHQHRHDTTDDADHEGNRPGNDMRAGLHQFLGPSIRNALRVRPASPSLAGSIGLTEDYRTEWVSWLEGNTSSAGVEHRDVQCIAIVWIYFQI